MFDTATVSISLAIATVLIVILLAKFLDMNRGLDASAAAKAAADEDADGREEVRGIVIGSEPYVTPQVDQEIREQMESLQQVLIPVQYVDTGLLSKIPENFPPEARSASLLSQRGPSAGAGPDASLGSDDAGAPDALEAYDARQASGLDEAFERAKFTSDLEHLDPIVIPTVSDAALEDVVPFNYVDGLVVTHDGGAAAFDEEDHLQA